MCIYPGVVNLYLVQTQILLTGAVIQETVSQNRKQKGTARERSNENSEEGSDDEVGSENRGSASKQGTEQSFS